MTSNLLKRVNKLKKKYALFHQKKKNSSMHAAALQN